METRFLDLRFVEEVSSERRMRDKKLPSTKVVER
jgi:hypothetical protein